jgi:moderate conductance mechanosensitive channel
MHYLYELRPVIAPYYALITHVLRLLVILAAAYIATRLISSFVPRIRKRIVSQITRAGSNIEVEKRAATLGGIFRKTLSVVIWIVAIIMGLREVGFDIAPILAGAGIVGLAVGFGAQNLVRDIISGIFLLLEDQVRVNDVAVVNGTGGLVEKINLRTIVLRGLDGTLHVFPNGSITTLSNMTHGYSYYVFDIGVAYKEDTDRVLQVLKSLGDQLMTEEPYKLAILEPLEVMGVDKFADSAVIVKARIKTVPIQQWTVGRELNRRIKKEFDRLGIEIPFPHMSLYFGEASKPIALQFDGESRRQLKAIVREVLAEAAEQGTSSEAGEEPARRSPRDSSG